MKNCLLLFGAFFLSGVLASCSKDDNVELDHSVKLKSRAVVEKNADVEDYEIKVRYKGVFYDVPCRAYGDSIVYLNEEFSDVFMNEISDNKSIVTYIGEDGVINYYESTEEMLLQQKIKFVESTDIIVSDGVTPLVGDYEGAGKAIMYDDKGCNDSHNLPMTIGYDAMLDIPRYDVFGMNDKTSSIELFSYVNDPNLRVVLISFENDTFNLSNPSKAVLYCVAKYGEVHRDVNLKHIPAHGRDSWNDRISSSRLRIATADLFEPHY